MKASLKLVGAAFCVVLCAAVSACGGGGGSAAPSSSSSSSGGSGTGSSSSSSSSGGSSSSSSSGGVGTGNVASIIVDGGPPGVNSINTLFVSVTVCAPGSTTACQTIDHIQVDTGSYGLRLLAPIMTVSLPVEALSNGNTVAECTQFVDGFSWGPIETADVQIAGETAKSMPVQAIGDSRYSNIPTDCSSTGTPENTVATFGANGILGIGPFAQDCPACSTTLFKGTYYACTSATSCAGSTIPLPLIMPNPVTFFATDNNGAIIQLPAVPAAGAANVTGTLTFGIDTQANNASGAQTVLTVNLMAELLMTYKSQSLANSFIDSGSNGIYFNDSSITNCTAPPTDPTSQIVQFYCPTATLAETVSLTGMNGIMANNLPFSVGNAEMISNTVDAFPPLAGKNPNVGSFDFGLPFFYGRRVAVAIQGETTTAGTGPYIAF